MNEEGFAETNHDFMGFFSSGWSVSPKYGVLGILTWYDHILLPFLECFLITNWPYFIVNPFCWHIAIGLRRSHEIWRAFFILDFIGKYLWILEWQINQSTKDTIYGVTDFEFFENDQMIFFENDQMIFWKRSNDCAEVKSIKYWYQSI